MATPSERRAAMKAGMADRHKESYEKKDDSGKYKSIFVKDAMGKVGFWKCSEDEHFLNIVPFFAGPNFPGANKEGTPQYMLDLYMHRKVGVNEDSYICMARTYNMPCAICEHQAELRKQEVYDDKFVRSLNPTRRAIYNVECLDSTKEVEKGIQIFDVSHYLFEKEVAELAKKPRGGGFELFSDPDEGKTIFFRKSGNSALNTEYKGFKFEDRDAPIPDGLLDTALVLDQIIHIPTYAEVKSAFFGSDIDDEIPTQKIEEAKADAEVGAANGRAVRRSAEPASAPATVAAEVVFKCPGEEIVDFGKFTVCDGCPDITECEEEFNKLEDTRIALEQAAAAAAATPVTGALTGLAARRAATAGAVAPPAVAAEEPAAADVASGAARRVRHRPGQ